MSIHKAGFVNIVGNPNVGKSTLMNALVGEKLSIITSKAQTTRHRILGIVSGEEFQIVYSDTPGVLSPKYKLQESMLKFATQALQDADVLLYVTDVYENIESHPEFLEKVRSLSIPVLLILNKVDMSDQASVVEHMDRVSKILPNASIVPVSALHKFNIEAVIQAIIDKLPESPAFFPKDELTDKTARFFVSEIIREKIFMNYEKEVPYSCEVEVEQFKEDNRIIHIVAAIHVERDSQKGIIIGKSGSALKKVGTQARLDIEAFFDKKVFLEIFVKVNKDWRNHDSKLKNFGYKDV